MKKFLWVTVAIIVVVLLLIIYWQYFFVFGRGAKEGHLNYMVLKGDFFKTYEGKLIQEGIRSKTVGSIQSYEFEFSVATKSIADTLMANSGKLFNLYYKEFHHAVPWRGNTRYVVDSIISMRDDNR